MKSKVEGALFYGAMFLCMSPSFYMVLVDLQMEFERSLLGAPPWFPAELIRAVAGWRLNWGERVLLEVLSFRAELWCSGPDLLVHKVWRAAQDFPGRTFASVSQGIVSELSVPEVYDFPGWSEYMSAGRPVLPAYKQAMRKELESRSCAEWKRNLHNRSNVSVHILAQQYPCSVGAIFLDHNNLNMLAGAKDFDKLRVGIVPLTKAGVAGQRKVCRLCGSAESETSHLLAICVVTSGARRLFMQSVDEVWRRVLEGAPSGDWPTAVLSPHNGMVRLTCAVKFAANVVNQLQNSDQ
jgi:hypothetical protein